MSTAPAPAPERFLLHGITWATYQRILEEQGERPIRITYDRGELELMTLSFDHERRSQHLNRIVEELAIELRLPIASAGSITINREVLDRGLEPDKCYYFANEPLIRGKARIDLDLDPPPDLAIEVDITRSSLNRLDIYAALGIPEVWRWSKEKLTVYHRREDGTYSVGETSLTFPFLPMTDVERLLREAGTADQLGWMLSLRAWIRAEVAPRYQGGPGRP